MSDVQTLAHVVDILIDLLVDRGYLFEAERKYFDAYYLDRLLGKRDEEDDGTKHDAGEPGGD